MIEIVRQADAIDVHLPVCASEAYLQSWSPDYGWFVDPQFVLPFYVAAAGPLRHMVITFDTVLRTPAAPVEEERAFLNRVVAASARMGIDFISQPKTTSVFRTFPDGAIHAPWGAYRVSLSPDEDRLFAALHPHHRRVVRKAQRDDVVVRNGPELLAVCHDIISMTLQRQRKPCLSLKQLDAFRARLGDQVSFYVAFVAGEPHASGLFIWDSASSYYIVGGTREHPHHGAGALLHWTAMRDMKSHGVGIYDFVGARVRPVSGSKQEGLQVFKSRFGTSLHRGHLWKYPVNPWKYRLYRSYRNLKDAVRRDRYYEDMIDNEIRTAHLPRSPLFPPTVGDAGQ
jgi:hypothetical protein